MLAAHDGQAAQRHGCERLQAQLILAARACGGGTASDLGGGCLREARQEQRHAKGDDWQADDDDKVNGQTETIVAARDAAALAVLVTWKGTAITEWRAAGLVLAHHRQGERLHDRKVEHSQQQQDEARFEVDCEVHELVPNLLLAGLATGKGGGRHGAEQDDHACSIDDEERDERDGEQSGGERRAEEEDRECHTISVVGGQNKRLRGTTNSDAEQGCAWCEQNAKEQPRGGRGGRGGRGATA